MLSISIVTYELDTEIFGSLLVSLCKAIDKLPVDVACTSIDIIDNGENALLIRTMVNNLELNAYPIQVIENEKNIGYGKAHNISILNTPSKYHLILNPDVVLDEDSLVLGIKHLEGDLGVVAICPSCTDADGKTQFIAKRFPSISDLMLRGFAPAFLKKIFDKKLANYELRKEIEKNEIFPVEIISGCFMLCRSDVLKEIKGFDERYFLYFEDFSLSLKLGNFGSLVFLPTMKIIHFGGHSAKKGFKHICYFIASAIKFFNQFRWKFR